MSDWIFFILGLSFPGLGIAAAYSRLDQNASAVNVIICSILSSLLLTSIFAFTLFATGTWDPIIFNLGTLSITCALCLLLHGKDVFRALSRNVLSLCIIPLAIVPIMLSYGPPSEWITYNHYDAGRYSNHAGFMLRTGSIKVDEPFEAKGLLEESDHHYPKYYYEDEPQAEFTLPYLHLFPAIIAVTRNQLGLENSMLINQILSFTGLLTFFALLQRYGLSTGWCCLGLLLLGTNPAYVFYAKRTMTEMLALNLVLGFFFFLSICEEFQSKLFAILTALTLFALATCRLEYSFIYCSIILALTCIRSFFNQSLRINYRYLAIVNALLLLPLGWYYITYCNFYIYRNTYWHFNQIAKFFNSYWRLSPEYPVAGLIIVVNAFISCLSLYVINSVSKRSYITFTSNLVKAISVFIAILVCFFLIYAWFLRPISVLYQLRGNLVFGFSKFLSLPRLFYFIDPISVFSVALAAVLSIKYKKSSPFLVVTLFSLLFGIINNYHTPITTGWIRLFLPLVIPGCYITLLLLRSEYKRWGRILVTSIIFFNVALTISSFVGITENAGAIKEFQEIKNSLGPRATIISFDGPRASVLTVPLHSQFDVPAVYLSYGLNQRKLTLFNLLLAANRNIYVIHAGSGAKTTFEQLAKQLTENGLTLSKHSSQALSLKSYDFFCQEWRPGKTLASLYIPPSLYGLCLKEITYPVSVWRISNNQTLDNSANQLTNS